MRLSVIVPAYNAADYIRQAIDSLLQQSSVPDEILVVDNGSIDATVAIVQQYGPPVRLLREPHKGASFARNRGIYEASGELIAFLDADDNSLPDRIEKQRRAFIDNPDTVLVFSAMAYTDAELHPTGNLAKCENFSEKGFFGQLLERNQIGSTSVAMVRRTQLLEAGGFDVNITHNEEYDLWLRLAASQPVKYLNEILVYYRIHGKNISRQREAQRDNEKKALQKFSQEYISRALHDTYPENRCLHQLAFARVLLRRGNIQGATKRLEILYHDCPQNSDAAFLLGVCHQLNGKNEEAENTYRVCLKLNPGQAEAFNNLGILATFADERKLAVSYFKKAIQLKEHFSDPVENLQIISAPQYNTKDLRRTLNTLRKELKPC